MRMQQKKQTIPKSLRANVWVHYNGKKFNSKCYIDWCKTIITPFDFEVGHDIPESKGGKTCLANLRPICVSCNRSMSNIYTITEYCEKFRNTKKSFWKCCFS